MNNLRVLFFSTKLCLPQINASCFNAASALLWTVNGSRKSEPCVFTEVNTQMKEEQHCCCFPHFMNERREKKKSKYNTANSILNKSSSLSLLNNFLLKLSGLISVMWQVISTRFTRRNFRIREIPKRNSHQWLAVANATESRDGKIKIYGTIITKAIKSLERWKLFLSHAGKNWDDKGSFIC